MDNKHKHREVRDMLSDEEIIELYWKREERAIDATDKKYGKYLYTIAYNIIHDNLDSEECLNDTYLGTWNRIPPARPNVFLAFLSKIMRNVAVDKFRKKTADKRIPSELVVSLSELDECIPSEAEADRFKEISYILNSFVKELSDIDAFIFVCRYYYSDTVDHIAGMLKYSKSTVYRQLSNMRNELKGRFEKEGITL